jgi:hypothetical protein
MLCRKFSAQIKDFGVAFELVWRMLVMAYRIQDNNKILTPLINHIKRMRFNDEDARDNDAENFIRGCAQFLISEYLKNDPNLLGDDKKFMFVLLVDESVLLVNHFQEHKDPFGVLRRTLLNDYLFANSRNIHCNLVMSALDIPPPPLACTDSRRYSKGISLPSKLNSTEIYENWIKPQFQGLKDLPSNDRNVVVLMKLVHLVGPVPRAIECLVSAIENTFGQGKIFFNHEIYNSLIDLTMTRFCDKYDSVQDPDPEVVRCALWEEPIFWSKAVARSVRDSFIVNAPYEFNKEAESICFIPRISALSLYRMKDTDHEVLGDLVTEVKRILKIDPMVEGGNQGDCLERLTIGIITARLFEVLETKGCS